MANDRVAIVTGGLGGIGKCFVKSLLKDGAKGVSIWDLVDNRADVFLKEIKTEFGAGKAIFLKVDVSDKLQIEDAFKKTIAHFNQLDIVINNAGIWADDNIGKMVQVNLTSVIESTNLAVFTHLPKYKKYKNPSVINIASITGIGYFDTVPMYGATKHGIVAYSRGLSSSAQYSLTNVRVMCICPGYVDTPIIKNTLGENFARLPNAQALTKMHVQSPESVAKALITVLKEGKNRSVWTVVNEILKEMDYQEIEKSINKQLDFESM